MDNNSSKNDLYKLVSEYRTQLMGFAALCIMFFHLWDTIFLEGSAISNYERLLCQSGFYGVDVFFFLSGMGLVNAIQKKPSLKNFYLRRMQRIFLPYIIASIIIAFVYKWTILDFVLNVSGYNFFAKSINSHLWYIGGIVILYLTFPLYYSFYAKTKNKFTFTGIALAIWLVISIICIPILREDFYGFINRIPIILLGVMFSEFKNKKADNNRYYVYLSILLFMAGLFIMMLFYQKRITFFFPGGDCLVPTFLLAISTIYLVPNLLSHLPKEAIVNKILAWFGKRSLELYCIQEIVRYEVLELCENININLIKNLIQFALVIVIAFILSVLNNTFASKINNHKPK